MQINESAVINHALKVWRVYLIELSQIKYAKWIMTATQYRILHREFESHLFHDDPELFTIPVTFSTDHNKLPMLYVDTLQGIEEEQEAQRPKILENQKPPCFQTCEEAHLYIESFATNRLGYTAKQFSQWGVPFPPPKNWKDKLAQKWTKNE